MSSQAGCLVQTKAVEVKDTQASLGGLSYCSMLSVAAIQSGFALTWKVRDLVWSGKALADPSHLIFYSLKTAVKRNCVQSSYKYKVHI